MFLYGRKTRPLGNRLTDTGTSGRGCKKTWNSGGWAGHDVPIKHFTPPEPHPYNALMAKFAGFSFDFSGKFDFGYAFFKKLFCFPCNLIGKESRFFYDFDLVI
jgi:hypothetical protein